MNHVDFPKERKKKKKSNEGSLGGLKIVAQFKAKKQNKNTKREMPPLGIEPRIFPFRDYEWNALPLGHKGEFVGESLSTGVQEARDF